jgi:hypothetical protein
MAKRVPGDIAHAQPFRHRFDEHPHDRHRPVRLLAPFPPARESLANTQRSWIGFTIVEDGTLYVCIRFPGQNRFPLEFSPQIVRVGTELCDSAANDFDVR